MDSSSGGARSFEDSGFDWDALRPPPAPVERRHTEMTLAWIVLLLLAFCPLLGFLLAYFA